MKTFAKIIGGFFLLLVSAVGGLYLQDRFWHPLKNINLQADLFGENISDISIESRVDFIGITLHGDIFDFYEYDLDKSQLDKFLKSERLKEFPKFGQDIYSTDKLQGQVSTKNWTTTPALSSDSLVSRLLDFSNFDISKASREFQDARYLERQGNYYSYFTGYPLGNNLFIIVPATRRLYIVRKK